MRDMMGRPAAKLFLTLSIAAIGGFAMWWLSMPLPWLLGAMFATGVCAILRAPMSVPAQARPPMTAMIGAMIGTSFNAGMFEHWAEWAIPLAGLVAFIAASGTACYFYFRWVAGFDHATAYFSGMPGGVVEMVILGSERGGDERMIALVHSARIFLVVSCIPFILTQVSGNSGSVGSGPHVPLSALDGADISWFLVAVFFGATVGIALRFPARYLTGPLAISAGLHYFGVTDFMLPTVLTAFAQVVLGASIGSRFATAAPRVVLKIFGLSLGSVAILLSITMVFALSISLWSAVPLEAVILAYSPGGIAEMSIVAVALHVDVPFVVLHHIARVLIVIAGATVTFRLLRN